jgi:PKHD-type hydroxylase
MTKKDFVKFASAFAKAKHENYTIDNKKRISNISWIKYNNDSRWFIDMLHECVKNLNNDYYKFELNNFEYIQYTSYDKTGSKYDYHVDLTLNFPRTNMRKLSVVMFLSDDSQYTGGKFILNTGKETEIEQKKGRIIVFPSFFLHRVTPIETGVRKSLVNWISGPAFK